MRTSLFLLASVISGVLAAKNQWEQCGGTGYTGETTCISPYACIKVNDFYSQCQAVATVPTPTTSSSQISGTTTSTTPGSTCNTKTAAHRPRMTVIPVQATTPGTSVTGLYLNNIAGDSSAVLHTFYYFRSVYLEGGTFTASMYYLNPFCADTVYLNIGSSPFSYKPLTWSYASLTTDWQPIPQKSTIKTKVTSPYGQVSKFLACKEGTFTKLYLQTGTDVPAGLTCALTELTYG